LISPTPWERYIIVAVASVFAFVSIGLPGRAPQPVFASQGLADSPLLERPTLMQPVQGGTTVSAFLAPSAIAVSELEEQASVSTEVETEANDLAGDASNVAPPALTETPSLTPTAVPTETPASERTLPPTATPRPRTPVSPTPEPAAASVGGTNAHLQRIKQCESSGNYQAYNPAGPFYGAYQFHQSTWDKVVGRAGYPEYVGVAPSSAPPSVQDAAAQYLYDTSGPGQWPACQYR
jgi:hypothetical protein